MPVRKAQALWEGNLKSGEGRISTESGAVIKAYSKRSRFEQGKGTNPEELIGAAHAGCFSMALSNALDNAGFSPVVIQTEARVHLIRKDNEYIIDRIELDTEAVVAGMDELTFTDIANLTKENCPVSKALKSVHVSLKSKLINASQLDMD